MIGIRLQFSSIFIWNLFTQTWSLWVAWVHENLLKGKCFWTVKKPQDCTWGWRTILKLRDDARRFLKYEVGDGRKIFLWQLLVGLKFKLNQFSRTNNRTGIQHGQMI